MNHLLLSLMVIALFLGSAARAASPLPRELRISPTPAWVQAVSAPDSVTGTEPQAVETLLLDDQVRLGATQEQFRHRVFRPRTTVGVESVSELKLTFNPAFETMDIHRILIRRGAETRDVTRTTPLRVVHREEQMADGIQDGEATVIAILDDVRAGDLIEYSYSLGGTNPIFGKRRFGYAALDTLSPIERLRWRLVTSREAPITVRAFNNPGVEIRQRDLPGGLREFRVERDRVAAIGREDNIPLWYSPLSWIEYSEYRDWQAVEDWAKQLYDKEAPHPGPLFDALYRRLAAGAKSPEDFITRALFAVQNEIRYLGLEFGEDSHRPRPVETVLSKRYGDCKDKALLLSRLLRRHGIPAWPALVSSRFGKGIGGQLPSPGVFDHVITRVDFDGKPYWLDGTRRYQAGPLTSLGRHDFGLALVIGDDVTGLSPLYPAPEILPGFTMEEHYYADDLEGPVRLETTTIFHGASAEAQRERFDNTPLPEIRKSWTDYASRHHEDLSVLKPLSYEDDPARNRFIVRESYRIGRFWVPAKQGNASLLQGPFTLSEIADTLRLALPLERQAPLQLPSPRVVSSRIYLHLPVNLSPQQDEQPMVTDHKAFRFTSLDRYYDRVYYIQSELVIREPEVAAGDYPTFQKALREVRRLWDFSINVPAPPGNGQAAVAGLRRLSGTGAAP